MMSSPERNTDQLPTASVLVAKIEGLQQELRVTQERLELAIIQAPMYFDTSGVFNVMSGLSKDAKALEKEIKTLQQKLEESNTAPDVDAA